MKGSGDGKESLRERPGRGRWVATGRCLPVGGRKGGAAPFEPPVGMGCWEDGVRPSPQTPLTGAGGTRSRLVRGWGV